MAANTACASSGGSSTSIRRPSPRLWTAPRHDRQAAALLPGGAPVLAIGPAANWRGKQWRADRFAELARRLTAPGGPLPGARVAVLAGAHEREQALPLLDAIPGERLIDLVGQVDLLTAAAVLRRCALFIGNDTGLMHIAAAIGDPDLGAVRPQSDREIRALGTVHRGGPHGGPAGKHVRAGVQPSDDRYIDGQPVGRYGRSGRVPALAPGGERYGMSAKRANYDPAPGVDREPTLSAVVVAHNEEAQLAACLSTLAFVDEIVVLLDRCTDHSREIASRFADRIVEGAWAREAARRTAAVAACTGDWIFEADADERVSPALATEIRSVVAHSAASWHLVPVDNYIGDRLVRWGWGAFFGRSAHAALYRRGIKSWRDDRVLHASVTLSGLQGPNLEERLAHYVDRNISDMLLRLDRYTSLRAQDLRRAAISAALPIICDASHRGFGNAMSAAAAIVRARMGF